MGLETIKEHADAEAEAAEREGADEAPDETPADEADQAPEAPAEDAPAPMGERELKALAKKIDAASDAHEKALRKLLGAQFETWFPCPLCMTDGHVDPQTLATIEPERVEAIQAAIGFEPEPEYRMLEGVERCPKCDGWGQVATPSRNEANRTKTCVACDSRGYREVIAQAPTWTPPPPPVAAYPNGTGHVPVTGELDAWNRPLGHPHFGVPPALVTG